jgi:hypothetical protein
MSTFALILVFPFVVFAAVIWAIIGLFFWIPLLAKATTIFTFSLLTHAIIQRPIIGAANNLQLAVTYYISGFYNIFRTLSVINDPGSVQHAEMDLSLVGSIFANLGKVIGMILFAMIFWFMFFLFLHHTGLYPMPRISEFETRLLSPYR